MELNSASDIYVGLLKRKMYVFPVRRYMLSSCWNQFLLKSLHHIIKHFVTMNTYNPWCFNNIFTFQLVKIHYSFFIHLYNSRGVKNIILLFTFTMILTNKRNYIQTDSHVKTVTISWKYPVEAQRLLPEVNGIGRTWRPWRGPNNTSASKDYLMLLLLFHKEYMQFEKPFNFGTLPAWSDDHPLGARSF
jgi:hypothetical protein